MVRPRRLAVLGLVTAAGFAAGAGGRLAAGGANAASAAPWEAYDRTTLRRIGSLGPLPPVPPDPTNRWADDDAAAHFGRWLFFDEGFGLDLPVSCATCHQPGEAFTDAVGLGLARQPSVRHTPTLLDVAHQRWLFWDGRSDTLWAQALEPFEDPKEYGSNRLRVVRRVAEDPALRAGYEAVFGPLPDLSDHSRFPEDARPVPDEQGGREHPHDRAWRAMAEADREAVNRAFVHLGKAIAAYERRLTGGTTPLDRFVADLERRRAAEAAGDAGAAAIDPGRHLSEAAQRGLELFVGRASCRTCHFGPLLSDGEFHANGVPPRNGAAPRDPGRFLGIRMLQDDPFNAGGRWSDAPDGETARRVRTTVRSSESWGQFRTPPLRHVGATAPYMREGQLPDLESVVRHYSTLEGAVMPGHHQQQVLQPLLLDEEEISDLVAFLESLVGPGPDASLLAPPASPVPPAPSPLRAR